MIMVAMEGDEYNLIRNNIDVMAQQSKLDDSNDDIDFIAVKKSAYEGLIIVRNIGINKLAKFELINSSVGIGG